VLKRSQEPDCQYAWGIANSLHLLGVAHARLGDKAKARDYLERAIEKRKPLEHPGLKETEAELRKLKGKFKK
jgi:Tetratricopeptide repeat